MHPNRAFITYVPFLTGGLHLKIHGETIYSLTHLS
jgi:hypothetical protein